MKVKIGKQETNLLQVLVKSPKEDRIGRNIIVDVYETKGQFCPVKYYTKWKQTSPPSGRNKPAYLKPNGAPLTGAEFNEILKKKNF